MGVLTLELWEMTPPLLPLNSLLQGWFVAKMNSKVTGGDLACKVTAKRSLYKC